MGISHNMTNGMVNIIDFSLKDMKYFTDEAS